MAECIRYVCNHCSKDLQSWSDGNPYFINASGSREYAYHPNHEGLARCIGNDSPHLCLQCGHGFRVDSRAPITCCPECGAATIRSTFELEGMQCPFCKEGAFVLDLGFRCLS